MENYAVFSIETHLFFARIMKEHALFLEAGFPCKDRDWISSLTGIAIDSRISEMEKQMRPGRETGCCRAVVRMVNRLNERALGLVNGLIQFKENILEETLKYREFKTAGAEGILSCSIASVILPLLADHVLREASHYIRILKMNCGGSVK